MDPTKSAGAVRGAMKLFVAAAVLASCGMRGPVSITSVEVGKDGRELSVYPNTCQQHESVKVVETATTVELTAEADRQFCSGAGCLSVVAVTLEEPVGDRAIIDTSSDRDVFVNFSES